MLRVEICSRIYSNILDCLNQDNQDLRIFRMVIFGLFVDDESCVCLNQDFEDYKINRMVIFSLNSRSLLPTRLLGDEMNTRE